MNKLLLPLLFICLSLTAFAQNDGNGGGGVRISFGNEYVEPQTLSGDDPAIPPKPKREFHTNSLILNQILSNCDDFEAMQATLEKFKASNRILLFEELPETKVFSIVYDFESKTVVSVFDKGNGKRMNLLNNQFETDDMYPNSEFGRIWFSIEE